MSRERVIYEMLDGQLVVNDGQLPRVQSSLAEQLETVHGAAQRLGMYDAADLIHNILAVRASGFVTLSLPEPSPAVQPREPGEVRAGDLVRLALVPAGPANQQATGSVTGVATYGGSEVGVKVGGDQLDELRDWLQDYEPELGQHVEDEIVHGEYVIENQQLQDVTVLTPVEERA